MQTLKWFMLGLLTLILVGNAQAGYLTPGLEKQISTLKGDDVIKVLVVLADQADIKALDWDLHDAKANLDVRHLTVLQTLQDTAQRSQGNLLSELEANKADGSILGFTSHWIVNSVVVAGTVDSIIRLAERADVERIEFDLHIELIEPVVSEKAASPDKGVGITPGVVAVGARRVWDELGIDGTGVIVGELDTGVDGTHVSLIDRWRGNFAPASECWLDAANLGHATPRDNHGHGTHTMGTVTGLAADDTIGVAPGALWIASNIVIEDSGSLFDNGVIASFEFMADPDNNPATMDDVPAVVQNSWGVNENFTGYYDCDSRWWDAIDNCEAAGVVVTWSAGNEGPGAQTLRSPGDRAASPGNCFSVGSTVTYSPYTISSFSSRGPSGCGGEFAMKPEIVAPGSDIYSAQPGGGYQYMSGTSMAGPHLAGVVALMRASNPNVDVITIKQVLMDTAIDLGTAGEDNTYGHGMVDAYAAVLAVMGGIGTVEGTITDSGSGLPIEGAVVRRVGGYNTDVTDANGFFSMTMPAESIDFTVEAFGYADGSFSVTIPEDGTVNGDLALVLLPTATVSGFVYDEGAAPVNGAIISVLGTPVADAIAGPDGSYSVVLPAAVGNYYNIRANAVGLGAVIHSVEVAADLTLDFNLPAWFGEDFESGDFSLNDWVMGGTSPWTITTTAHEGQYAARSGDISDEQTSSMEITIDVTAVSDLTFWYKVSTESGYDYLRFYVDGNQQQQWAGELDWAEYSASIAVGLHTFRWEYDKDYSVSNGDDAVYVDFVEFPVAALPNIEVDVTEFEEFIIPVGHRGYHPMNISNTGEGPLTWDIALYQTWENQEAPANLVDHVDVPKGQIDTREGVDPLAGWAGPDAFGYHWEDSNAPGGPVYDWVDIASEGVLLGHDDEAVYGPFNLGFDFTYYGNSFDSIRVSTNGWVSFTSSNLVWTNQGIPDPGQPNNMIAIFWDDLNPSYAGDIYYLEDTTNNRFIVQYENIRNWESSSWETFQVILNADGSIVCQYETVQNPNFCTVGIENGDGTDGLQVAFNSDYLQSGMAIAYLPPEPLTWVTATPLVGQTGPGGSTEVDVFFHHEELGRGIYTAEMVINSNDPDTPAILLPVTLTKNVSSAVGHVLPNVVRLEGAVPNPFNPATDIKFSLPRDAGVVLNLYDVSGRLVRSLVNDNYAAGSHEVRWNGKDDTGHGVASGTYFARLAVDGVYSVKSMVLVR
jgi:subtilisin family serine protease